MAQPAERLAGVLQGGPDHLGRSLGAQPRATTSKEIQFRETTNNAVRKDRKANNDLPPTVTRQGQDPAGRRPRRLGEPTDRNCPMETVGE